MPPLYEPMGPGYGRYTFGDGSHELMTEDDARTFQQLHAATQPAPSLADPGPAPLESPPDDGSPAPDVAFGLPAPAPAPGSAPLAGGIVDPFAAPQVPGALAPIADALAGGAGAVGGAVAGAAGDIAAPGPPLAAMPSQESLPAPTDRPALLPVARPGEIASATRDDVYGDRVHAYDAEAKAKAGDALIQSQGAADTAVMRDQANAEAAKIAQEAEAKRVATEAKIKATADSYDSAVKDFINTKVDRPRLDLGDIIGTILAGAGAVANHDSGPNPAIAITERRIQQTVDDQYKRRASMKEGIDLLGGQLSDQRKELGDVLNNRHLLTAALWEDTGHRLASIGDRVTDKLEQNALHHASAEAFNKAAEAKADGVEKKLAEDKAREMQQAALHQQDVDSRRSAWTSRANQKDELAYRREKDDADRANRVEVARSKGATKAQLAQAGRLVANFQVGTNPDGTPILYEANDAKAWGEVSDVRAAAQRVNDITQQMIRLRAANPDRDFLRFKNGPAYQEFTSLAGQLAGEYKNLEKLGALDAGVEKMVAKVGGGSIERDTLGKYLATSLWQADPKYGLAAMGKGAVDKFNALAESKRRAGTPFQRWTPLDTTNAPAPDRTGGDELAKDAIGTKVPNVYDPGRGSSVADMSKVQSQIDQMSTLAKDADPAKAADGLRAIESIATSDQRPDVQQAAIGALLDLGDTGKAAAERVRANMSAGGGATTDLNRDFGLGRTVDEQRWSRDPMAIVADADKGNPLAVNRLGSMAFAPGAWGAGDIGKLEKAAQSGSQAATLALHAIASSGGDSGTAGQWRQASQALNRVLSARGR